MKIINRLLQKLIPILDLQLALTAISLPFIIGAGLPISVIAVAGNIIFGPFLTVFLLLASLIFVTQLLHIPNGLLVILLEWCNSVWAKFLSFTTSSALLSVPTIPAWGLAVLFVVSCLIVCPRVNIYRRIMFFFMFLILVLGALKLYSLIQYRVCRVQKGTTQLTFIKTHDQLICIDPGIKATSLKSWFFYTLLSELRKELGTTTVTTYIALKPNKGTVELCRLFDLLSGTRVVMPYRSDQLEAFDSMRNNGFKIYIVSQHNPLNIILDIQRSLKVKLLLTNHIKPKPYCYVDLDDAHHHKIILPKLTRYESQKLLF